MHRLSAAYKHVPATEKRHVSVFRCLRQMKKIVDRQVLRITIVESSPDKTPTKKYMRSNLWSSLANDSAIAVVFECMHTYRRAMSIVEIAQQVGITYIPLQLCLVTAGHNRQWLVVDEDLGASRTPVDELNCSLGLYDSDPLAYS